MIDKNQDAGVTRTFYEVDDGTFTKIACSSPKTDEGPGWESDGVTVVGKYDIVGTPTL